MAQLSLHGVFTALVTPFSEDASTIDFSAYEKLLQKQLEAGVAGVVPCGTTGETPTLSGAEQLELIRFTKRVVGNKDVLIRRGANGGTEEVPVDSARARLLCLDDAQLIALHRLAERCESVYGGAQDLEWAYAGSELFLLQRRPITTAH